MYVFHFDVLFLLEEKEMGWDMQRVADTEKMEVVAK